MNVVTMTMLFRFDVFGRDSFIQSILPSFSFFVFHSFSFVRSLVVGERTCVHSGVMVAVLVLRTTYYVVLLLLVFADKKPVPCIFSIPGAPRVLVIQDENVVGQSLNHFVSFYL